MMARPQFFPRTEEFANLLESQKSTDDICKLADYYLYGRGVNKSVVEAIKYYEKAAEANSVRAQKILGLLYHTRNYEVSTDLSQSFKYYKMASDLGDAEAKYMVAIAYKEGWLDTVSVDNFLKYMHLSAQTHYASAYLQLAECIEQGVIPYSEEEALHYYQLAKANSNSYKINEDLRSFLLQLAKTYESTDGGKVLYYSQLAENYSKTHKFDQKLKQFYLELAKSYQAVEDSKAVYYFSSAADLRCWQACYPLANHYRNGNGCEKSSEMMIYYLKLGAELGDPVCQYELGCCYENGSGIVQSLDEAAYYYKIAADRENYLPAVYKIAQCYLTGKGIRISKTKAYHYFKIAAEKKYKDAEDQMKLCEPDKEFQKEQKKLNELYLLTLIHNPNAKQLDTNGYSRPNFSKLREIFQKAKDQPIYLLASHLMEEEIDIIKEAMVENKQFAFICPADEKDIDVAFELAGYDPRLCLKRSTILIPNFEGKYWCNYFNY